LPPILFGITQRQKSGAAEFAEATTEGIAIDETFETPFGTIFEARLLSLALPV
jgi:hypothetical protein